MHDDVHSWTGHTRLGDGWAFFEGRCGDTRPHRHLAAQMIVGLFEPVRVETTDQALAGPAILIRAGALHAVRPTTTPARVIYVQSYSPLGLAWSALGAREELVLPPTLLSDQLRVSADLGHTLSALTAACPQRAIDERLWKALNLLMQTLPGAVDIGEAAKAVALSEARLRALAADQLGAPLSQWRMWFMLERALRSLGKGQSLAGAAAEAGFSDQAHLSRTMRRFMGVTPRTAARAMASS